MRIHILDHGRPLCRFSTDVPGRWPAGHKWVGADDYERATCKKCRGTLAARDFVRMAKEVSGTQ